MIYSKIPLAQTVVQLCKAKGVKHIIISPGSRNSPLTIGFTNDDYFSCYSIVDERSAAFFALGISQQLRQPTALVCTSGSALLNYYPAISEAFYSNIPLIVLSADRPKHLIGIGDGQAINQKNVFSNHILYSTNLKLDLKDEKNIPVDEDLPMLKNIEDKIERFLGLQKDIQIFNEDEINLAINSSILKKGPVHINVPLDEPLYDTVSALTVSPKAEAISVKQEELEDYVLRECFEDWSSASKKMILVGVNYPNDVDEKWLNEFANDSSVIVFTETTSNIHHSSFFPSIDQIVSPLSKEEQKQLQPDILVTFGGMIVSKKIKQILRKFKPKQHWHIDDKMAYDTFFALNKHIEMSPNDFFKTFLSKVTHYVKSDYRAVWNAIKEKRLSKHNQYLTNIPFSDFTVFNDVLASIPNNSVLQVSNSSAIRYTQLFTINKSVEVYCNRGTSGIDGSTSTAVGCAVATNKQTIFITGDLGFFYDSNALWNNYIPNNFRIIVINNRGGGIFRIQHGHKNTENFDTFFETRHQLTAEHLCKMYGFSYDKASNSTELKSVLSSFYSIDRSPKLLEVFTPARLNDEILLNYFEYIK